MGDNSNGHVVDLASAGQPPEGERGTAVDRNDRVFPDFDQSALYITDDVEPRRIDAMLAKDGKARSIEQALTLPLRSVPFSLEAAAGDQGQRDFVWEALTRPANAGGMSTPLELVIAQAVSACLYRRAFFEKVFKYVDGQVVYDKLAFRPPATCQILYDKRDGAFTGFRQYVGADHPNADDQGKVTIKPEKAFVFVYGQHRKPLTGVSDLDTVYALWEAKQKVRFLWFTFLENLTMPKAKAKHSNNDETEIQKFAKKVATLKGGGVVGIGPDQDVEPFETSNTAAQVFGDAIRFLDSEMSGSVLAGFTDLTGAAASGRGSFALSADQSDLFLESRQAVLRELSTSIVGWVIADLVRWNFGVAAPVPVFKFGPLLHEHVDKALELLQTLAGEDNPPVPREFIVMLAEKVASYLGLDMDRVMKAFREQLTQAPQDPTSQLTAGIAEATRIIQQNQAAVPA